MSDLYLNQPLVLDGGSGLIKCGFAGTELPKLIAPAYIGRIKHVRAMAGALESDILCGDSARAARGLCRLSYPMKSGVVTDWDALQTLYASAYSACAVSADHHPLLITEAPLTPATMRARMCELLFESFSAPAMHIAVSSVLSLYASGRTTGAVIDIGDGVMSATPVVDGFVVPHAVQRSDVAGRAVSEYLALLIRRASGAAFVSSAELDIVREIKEKCCYVSYHSHASADDVAVVVGSGSSGGGLDVEPEVTYRLPDGSALSLTHEKYRACELLFTPSHFGYETNGAHVMAHTAIARSDCDLRRALYGAIILSGGSTMFDGFGDRLLSELRRLSPRECKIKIWAPPERIMSVWIGGSILASLATFKTLWTTKAEYEEMGKSAVFRKTY